MGWVQSSIFPFLFPQETVFPRQMGFFFRAAHGAGSLGGAGEPPAALQDAQPQRRDLTVKRTRLRHRFFAVPGGRQSGRRAFRSRPAAKPADPKTAAKGFASKRGIFIPFWAPRGVFCRSPSQLYNPHPAPRGEAEPGWTLDLLRTFCLRSCVVPPPKKVPIPHCASPG